ncbi:family 16 glycoside hydrolase [Cohnella sp. GCM10012308]|uniref:family 16 glycoside hydrolase n=1 Tax=Cohnella sp. GCM10012308 TaxID=3317329 RepID=UPI00360B2431
MRILKNGRSWLSIGLIFTLMLSCTLSIPSLATKTYANNTTYYVDSVGGSDSNSGLSDSSAWQSLAKVNATTFQPGDVILFKAGSVWSGQLHPLGSGTSGAPIVIDKYGSGGRPIINGNGLIGGTVYFYNQQYWEINNLEVTNSATAEGDRYGIKVEAHDVGTYNHFYIQNNYVHDVKGTNSDALKATGGILVLVTGTAVRSKWNDVRIDGNTVERVDRTGINNASSWGNNDNAGNFEPFTNLVISNNTLNDIGGDGIVMRSSINGLIQYNVVNAAHNRDTHYDVAIWAINSTNPVMQYNEAYNTKTTNDGHGFDCDFNLTGCTVQYNYSHDNEGGFLLIMGVGAIRNDNMVVRYNISQNDRTRTFQFSDSYTPLNAGIYNNTIYVGSGLTTNIVTGLAGSNPLSFKNNIVYNLGSGGYAVKGNDVYDYNIFYGNHPTSEPSDPHKLTSDPLLVTPGSGGTGRNTVDGYKLVAGSPAIGSGVLIGSNGGKDYWGNAVSSTGAPNRGAYNGAGIPVSNSSLTLQSDDFETGTATGWTASGGTWSVVTDGTKVYNQSNAAATGVTAYSGQSTWQNYTVSAKVKADAFDSTNYAGAGLVARRVDDNNYYVFMYYKLNNTLKIVKVSGGAATDLVTTPFSLNTGNWYDMKAVVNGSTLEFWVGGVKQLSTTDTSIGAGQAGLYSHRANAKFDDVKVAPIFGEDFEAGYAAGWTLAGGTWSVATDGTKVYNQSSTTSASAIAYAGQTSLQNYTVSAKVKADAFDSGNYAGVGLVARRVDSNNYYVFMYYKITNTLKITKVSGGVATDLISTAYSLNTGTWYDFKAVANGSTLELWVNGTKQLTTTDTAIASGQFGLYAHRANAKFDNVLQY